MKMLKHLVVINPGGKETAKQCPYDKDGEHVIRPDPGCNSPHQALSGGRGSRFPAPPRWLGSLHLQTSVPVLHLPLHRSRNCAILLFFKLSSQTVHFLPPRCIVRLQAINTRSIMPCSALGTL